MIEFAQKIKAKYPQYNDMSDLELAEKMLAKYPEYNDLIKYRLNKEPETIINTELGEFGKDLYQNLQEAPIPFLNSIRPEIRAEQEQQISSAYQPSEKPFNIWEKGREIMAIRNPAIKQDIENKKNQELLDFKEDKLAQDKQFEELQNYIASLPVEQQQKLQKQMQYRQQGNNQILGEIGQVEKDYETYSNLFDSQAATKNVNPKAPDYRFPTVGGKKKLTPQEFALWKTGKKNALMFEAWLPEEKDLESVGALGNFGAVAGNLGEAFTSIIGIPTGLYKESDKFEEALQIKQQAETVKQVKEIKDKIKKESEANPEYLPTEQDLEFLKENDKTWYEELGEGAANIPELLYNITTNPEDARKFFAYMLKELPASLVTGTAVRSIPKAIGQASNLTKRALTAKKLQNRVNTGENTVKAVERFKQSQDGYAARQALKDRLTKNPLGLEPLIKDFGIDAVTDSAVETLIEMGYGGSGNFFENLGESVLDATGLFGTTVARKLLTKENGYVTPEEFDKVFGTYNVDTFNKNRPDKSAAVLQGNTVLDIGIQGENADRSIKQSIETIAHRPDVANEIRQLAGIKDNAATLDQKYRFNDKVKQLTPEEIQRAGYEEFDENGNPIDYGVRGYREDGINNISQEGGTETIAHETLHGIEEIFSTNNNLTDSQKELKKEIGKWVGQVRHWANENEIKNLPSNKEIVAQTFAYRLGFAEPQADAVKDIPVPDILLKKVGQVLAPEQTGARYKGDNLEFDVAEPVDNLGNTVKDSMNAYSEEYNAQNFSTRRYNGNYEDLPFSLAMKEASKNIPENVKNRLGKIWDAALKAEGQEIDRRFITLSDVSNRLNKEISNIFGKEVKANKQHIRLKDVRHIDEIHGIRNENKSGQIPVTKETFMLIPDVLENFDKVDRGTETVGVNSIKITKNYLDGRVVVADAVLENGDLSIRTMYVKKPATVSPRNAKAPSDSRLSNTQPRQPTLHENSARFIGNITKQDNNNIEKFYSLSPKQKEIADNAPESIIYRTVWNFLKNEAGFKGGLEEVAKRFFDSNKNNKGRFRADFDNIIKNLGEEEPAVRTLLDTEELGAGEAAFEIASKYSRLSDKQKLELGEKYLNNGQTNDDIEAERKAWVEENLDKFAENGKTLKFNGEEYKGKYELNNWKSLEEFLKNEIRTLELNNRDTGEQIKLSGKGIDKLIHRAKTGGDIFKKTIAYLPEIIENMTLIDLQANRHPERGYNEYQRYLTEININGKDYTVLSIVAKSKEGFYYDQQLFTLSKEDFINKEKKRFTDVGQLGGAENIINSSAGTESEPINKYSKKSSENLQNNEKDGDYSLTDLETPESIFGETRRLLQDSLIDLKHLGDMQANKDYNAYEAYDRSYGLKEWQVKENLEKKYAQPIMKIIKQRKLNVKAVNNYLYALHAKAVNDYVASKNPKFLDGSGMTTENAAEIIKNVDSLPETERTAIKKIAQLNRELNNYRMGLLVDSGLWSKEYADILKEKYPNYVPLRGLPEEMAEEMEQGRTISNYKRGYLATQDNLKRKGRKSEAQDVLAQNFALTMNAIVNAERNKATQHLWNMAKNNPDSKFWELDPSYKKSKNVKGEGTLDTQKNQIKDVVPVYIDGEKHFIRFITPQGKRIAKAVKGLNESQAGAMIKALGKFNRFIGAAITSYNPQFVLTNFVRDYQQASFIGFARYGTKVAGQIIYNTPKAIAGLWGNDLRLNTEWGEWRDKYHKAGGAIGFTRAHTFRNEMKKYAEQMNDLNRGKYNPKKALNKTLDAIETINGGVEEAVRIVTFRALVDKGMSPEKAALAGKDLTVNFNRHGDAKWTNSFWLFFNASIQGLHNVASVFADKDPTVRKRAYGAAAALMSAGFAMGVLGYSLAREDENGRSEYENIPEYVKQMNIVIPTEAGKYIKFPIPHGLNIIYNTGRMVVDVMQSKRFDKLDFAAAMFGNILDGINAFGSDINLTEADGTIIRNFTPAILKPILDIYMNEDFSGRKIHPENSNFTRKKPDSRLGNFNVNPVFKAFAESANDLTGGSDYKSGFIDINPSNMEHIFNGYTGGIGKLIQQSFAMAKAVTDENEEMRDNYIPFYSRFRGEVSPAQDKAESWEYKDEARNVWQELKDIMASGDKRKADEFKRKNYGIIKFYQITTKIDRQLSKLSSQANDFEKRGKENEAKNVRKNKKTLSDKVGSVEIKAWDSLQNAKTHMEVDNIMRQLNADIEDIFNGNK